MKMVPNVQTNFERTLVNKLLPWDHLEQKVINILYVTSRMIEFYKYQITLIFLLKMDV